MVVYHELLLIYYRSIFNYTFRTNSAKLMLELKYLLLISVLKASRLHTTGKVDDPSSFFLFM